MYVVSHYNIGTFREFLTFGEAKAYAIKASFEAVVMLDGMQVARYSPISGFWRDPAFW